MDSVIQLTSSQLAALFIIILAAIEIYKDAFKKRPYDWLISHYLKDATLKDLACIDSLRAIKDKGGCSKNTFRREIMRPLMERK